MVTTDNNYLYTVNKYIKYGTYQLTYSPHLINA